MPLQQSSEEQNIQSTTDRDAERSEMTQRDYHPTPFSATTWEVVGQRSDENEFMSLALSVLQDKKLAADPMFAAFDEVHTEFVDGEIWEAPGGAKRKKEEVVDDTPKIDVELLEEECRRSFEEGKAAGIAEAEADAQARIVESYEALASRMLAITEEIKQQINERMERLEKQALKLSLDISRKLVETTAEVKPEYIVDIIRQGMKNLGAAKPIKVRVSSQDFEFLEVVGLPSDLTPHELGVQYVSDESIKSGCIVETDFGEVNLELDKMWEQIRDSLYPVCK